MAAIDIAKQVGTTKGDLYVYDGSTLVRLPVGTDGQVLTAASGETEGVEWASGGGGGGAMEVIAETVLGSAASEIDWTSIAGTYRHLQILLQGRTSAAVSNAQLRARFNNDSTAIYDNIRVFGNASTAGASTDMAATSGIFGAVNGTTSPADNASANTILIPNYAGTTFNKAANIHLGQFTGTAAANAVVEARTMLWRSTAAINRITLFPASGDFVAGTVATLYGLATL